MENAAGVFGADITLAEFTRSLERQQLLPNRLMFFFDRQNPIRVDNDDQRDFLGSEELSDPVVQEIAGAHHETMIGSGYPPGLKREEMPLAARIMAIADIFEALTAGDRHYKKPKKIGEALRIMNRMSDDRHIDAGLFTPLLAVACTGPMPSSSSLPR